MGLTAAARVALFAALAVGLVAGAIAADRTRRATVPAAARSTDGADVVRGSLGPTPGPDAEGYIAAKRRFLEELAARDGGRQAAALVSLARSLRAAEVAALAAGIRVDALFVLFPGDEPESIVVLGSVEASLTARAQDAAAAREAEAKGFEDLARQAPPAERQRLLREASLKRQIANQIRRDCACVYAVVVAEVSLARLSGLQRGPDVRLVDVTDPPVGDLRGWELRPILPRR